MRELRETYFKKMAYEAKITPEIVELENQFGEMVKKVNILVRTEYPRSKWSFHQKNVGGSIVLNSKVDVDIITFDGRMEKRTVLIKEHKAYALEPIVNTATPEGTNPHEEYKKTQKDEIKTNVSGVQMEKTPVNTPEVEQMEVDVQQWFEDNFEYLESLKNQAIKKENASILIPQAKYEKNAAEFICELLIQKWGYESASVNENGILAALYTEN